jgi:peptide/nickel transport system permease protein
VTRYILRRSLAGAVTLLGITFVTFLVISLAPGDPAEIQLIAMDDMNVSGRLYEQLREYYNLDKPIHVQYAMWIGRLARGDFGQSFHDGLPVRSKIADAFWPTLSVSLLSILLTYLIAVPLGIISAVKQGGWFDTISSTILYMIYAIPPYVIGMVLILIVGVEMDWLPFQGMHSDGYEEFSRLGKIWDGISHYALITISFTVGSLAYYSRFTRQNLLEVIRQDYVRTARAKGLPEHLVILKHAFPNTLIPLITLMSLTFPYILSGSVILETMFNWPGLGRLFFDSVLRRDYPTVMGLSVITATLVLFLTLLADLAYALVDPRVRYE